MSTASTSMLSLLVFLLFGYAALAQPDCTRCGCKGGPGYRGPDGHCVGWANLRRICGSPPSLRCTPELVHPDAHEAAASGAKQSLTGASARKGSQRDKSNLADNPSTYGLIGVQPSLGDVTGPTRVVDGDTLVVDGVVIRLDGIDAPETDQICLNDRGERWRCGITARNRLRENIGRQEVSCAANRADRYGRTLATCSIGAENLNAWLGPRGLGACVCAVLPNVSGRRSRSEGGPARNVERRVHCALGLAQPQQANRRAGSAKRPDHGTRRASRTSIWTEEEAHSGTASSPSLSPDPVSPLSRQDQWALLSPIR